MASAPIPLQELDLLRFTTAGSVDDGKSTLIGRLLYDSQAIFEDQLSAIRNTTRRRGMAGMDLSLLTDGLVAEREQGITIDVAYRYFTTPRRKFIIADTPGHEQYTRNMVTGASTANLAVVLVDARKGLLTQSRRHTAIANLLGIPHLLVAVNKMDLVGYDQQVFENIRREFAEFAARLNFSTVDTIPISALNGDMVVERGDRLSWYSGPTLLERLETIEIDHDLNLSDLRFPVQWVCRPQTDEYHDFRGYAGRIESGAVAVGEEIVALSPGQRSRIARIVTLDCDLPLARAPQSATLVLQDDLDISRGDMLVKADSLPRTQKDWEATVCWLSEQPMDPRRKYWVKHTTRTVKGLFTGIRHRLDVNTLAEQPATGLAINDIARVGLKVQQPLMGDDYRRNRATGCFIVIDEATNNTVAAGLLG